MNGNRPHRSPVNNAPPHERQSHVQAHLAALSANMSETLLPPEFNVEGGARKCVDGKSHGSGGDTGGGSGREGGQTAPTMQTTEIKHGTGA